ncbi:MAG: hypothetical protein U0Q19_09560 [Kineosporiaceae bacterium]
MEQELVALIGHRARQVRRLFFNRRGQVDESVGALEIVWDGGAITRIDTRPDWSLLISDRAWTDPFDQPAVPVDPRSVAETGRWARYDVSLRPEFRPIIGHSLRAVAVRDSEIGQPVEVDLAFPSATITIRSVGGEPIVNVYPETLPDPRPGTA